MNHSRHVILRRLSSRLLNSSGNHHHGTTTSKETFLAAMGVVASASTAATFVAYQQQQQPQQHDRHNNNNNNNNNNKDDDNESNIALQLLSFLHSTVVGGNGVVVPPVNTMWTNSTTTACDDHQDDDQSPYYVPPGYSEPEAFQQCLEFHRSQLDDYRHRWDYQNTKIPTSTAWPQHLPSEQQVPTLETDFYYCTRSPNYRRDETYCDNLQFRIATYYIQHSNEVALQQKGFKSIKDLAERGHANGMCYYGIVLNECRVPGVDANPAMAVFWWRRCVELYKHVPSMYELAVALYTGEGVAEDETKAVHYFRQAANTGHAPAAYMLGDCLLDGVGCVRDRAEALDWLVTAAELGHRGARSRVMAVLERQEDTDYGAFTDASRQTFLQDVATKEEEDGEQDIHKWAGDDDEPTDGSPKRPVSIERRFTIGGGSGNPVVLARRKTLVDESRNL